MINMGNDGYIAQLLGHTMSLGLAISIRVALPIANAPEWKALFYGAYLSSLCSSGANNQPARRQAGQTASICARIKNGISPM